jgi:hypothetical protein
MDKKHSKKGRPKKIIPDKVKPTNGHLSLQESKRTIILSWGKYSITALCLTAVIISLIWKVKF